MTPTDRRPLSADRFSFRHCVAPDGTASIVNARQVALALCQLSVGQQAASRFGKLDDSY